MSSQSGSRFWFLVHSWIGLKLSLFMSFVLITGTIAVLSHEIDWLINPAMRAPASVAENEVDWGAAYDSVRQVYPEGRLLSLNRYHNDAFALSATMITEWRENTYLWFNPADGAYRGASSFYNVQRFFRNTHRHLMLPVSYGVPIVTALALPLLLSLLAGLIVYKKFWRGFLRWPRFHRKARIWLGDLHRLTGLWISWFLIIIALTSVFYFVEEFGLRGTPFPPPDALGERADQLPAQFTGADLDTAIANARATMPGLEIRRILFPSNSNGAIAIQGDHSAVLVRERANTVYIDPQTLEVAGSYRGENLDFYTRISEAADPLHFGNFASLPTQILWFVLGTGLSALSVTGVLIYVKRLRPGTSRKREYPGKEFNQSSQLVRGDAV